MSRIAIVQSIIADYRVAFYSKLHSRLAEQGCDLTLFASRQSGKGGFKEGLDALSFATEVRRIDLAGGAYWQPLLGRLGAYDLVIVEQANRVLLNYPLFLLRYVTGRPKAMAFWGHGATLQGAGRDGIRKWLKTTMIGAADHWFAYTGMTSRTLIERGYPADRITTVNNSIDTTDVSAAAERKREVGRDRFRASLGLTPAPSAVFCSRLYAGKKLEFLLAAADLVKTKHPGFELVIIGDGPERRSIEAIARSKPWIKPMGALYGREKADQLAAADLMLLPAWVGLSILDGFAAGLPVIAADFDNHSPEIAYLEDGSNGLFTRATFEEYAAGISAVLEEPLKLAHMSAAATASAEKYSLDSMVDNFAHGVAAALASRAPAVRSSGGR